MFGILTHAELWCTWTGHYCCWQVVSRYNRHEINQVDDEDSVLCLSFSCLLVLNMTESKLMRTLPFLCVSLV